MNVVEKTRRYKKPRAGGASSRVEPCCSENRPRRRAKLLGAIFDNSTRVIYLKDRAGRYLLVNRQYEELFHLSCKQIVGKTDHDIFSPETAETLMANDLKVLQAGSPLEFEEVVPHDGELHTYLSNKYPIRDSTGAVYAVCGISTDITDHKRFEKQEALGRKRAETWLDRLIETTQDAVVSIDRNGRVVVFNPSAERIFGYSRGEVEGKNVSLLMAEPYASEHESYIARYQHTGEPRAIGRIRTVLGKRKSGEIFPAELSVTEVTAQDDIRYAAFIRDISEKSRLQNQLIESERLAAVGATAAKLAHEIGNPLNGMAVTAQLLQRRLARKNEEADGTAQSALQRLTNEISRLGNMLHEFGSLSRREKYNFTRASLALVVAEVLEFETSNYPALGIHVEQAFPEDLPLVYVDTDKVKQAILNLIKNAVEAMPRGGSLILRGSNSGQQVELEIADTGVGIPEGVDIFEPFATTKSSGTGLGLVIVRQIVSAHGGTVSYSSERGKGTVFRVALPCVQSLEPLRSLPVPNL